VLIFLRVRGPKGAKTTSTAKVTLSPADKIGKAECALPGPPEKPAERLCDLIYEKGTKVTLTAVPDASTTFHKWSDLCAGSKSNPVCEFDVEFNGDEATAEFKKQ
jgi:hypothetical protein